METGLLYYRARYYDPELGRFLQPDPIVPNAFDPQSLNRYAYVGNDPLTRIDPSGLSASEPKWEDLSAGQKAEYCQYYGYCGGSSWVPGGSRWSGRLVPGSSSSEAYEYVMAFDRMVYEALIRMLADLDRMMAQMAEHAQASAPAQLPPLPEEELRGVSQNARSSQSEKSPYEVAMIAIFQNREVPQNVVEHIPRDKLAALAELRVTIAEFRQQPRAAQARDELEMSKFDIQAGMNLIAMSTATSLVAVLSPSRTPAEIAEGLGAVVAGPEGIAAKEGSRQFLRGLEGLKILVRQPIGPPIR